MAHSAEKELGKLPKSIVPVLWKRIKALAREPRPRQSRKLKETEKAYRLRVRDYRIIYTIDDEQKLVTIVAVGHRKEIYC